MKMRLFEKISLKNRFGFTLAEVLITLGIIGVLAAMTIPNLISTYRKKQIEIQAKVTYSTIQQALRFAAYDDVGYSEVADGNNQEMINWFNNFLGQHLKVEQLCVNKAPGCWHQIYYLNGNKFGDQNGTGSNILGFVTSKGARFIVDGYAEADIKNQFGVNIGTSGLVFIYDANGATKPNTVGKDVFVLVWTEKGLVPAGHDKTREQVRQNCQTGNGLWCLKEVIDHGWTIPDYIWRKH
ncbi:type II secretion system protein [bacterium]|nr:type II secretion system protein [bacterium]